MSDADSPMKADGNGNLDFGANAISADRKLAATWKLVKAGERADAGRHLLPVGGCDQRLDALETRSYASMSTPAAAYDRPSPGIN